MHVVINFDDGEVRGALLRLLAFGGNMRPALVEIAALGERSTGLRFRQERGPDGEAWEPSLRAQLTGGRTLTKDGHLSGSISARAGRDFAEWGVNRIYAAIHQFGGAAGRGLRTQLVSRPYLGVNGDDQRDILDVVERHIAAASGGTYAG